METTSSGRGLVVVTATVVRRHWGWGMLMMSRWMTWRDILIRCSTYQDQCLIWHSSCTPDAADIPSLCHSLYDRSCYYAFLYHVPARICARAERERKRRNTPGACVVRKPRRSINKAAGRITHFQRHYKICLVPVLCYISLLLVRLICGVTINTCCNRQVS